jgi:16S rRNA (uracil1498-N3)-methyltransferase
VTTTPLFLVRAGALARLVAGDAFVLDGDEGRHAATVRRIRAGERVDVADGDGCVARCEVAAAGRDRLDLAVLALDLVPAPSPAFVLAQALAKGGRDEQAVETATELGVDAVVPWQASRSVVRWEGERGEKSRRRWAATAREAAKQSRRAWLPQIGGDPDLSTKLVAERLRGAAAAFVLHEEADQRLSAVPLPDSGDIVLVIGPEGGIDDRELAAFDPAVPVRLGAEVLRTSTAGVAAVAVLATRLGRW